MNYLCLVYGQPQEDDARAPALDTRAAVDALSESGYEIAAYALSPAGDATTLRVTGDGIVLRDGPVSAAGALLRTVFVLKARDLNDAVRIVSWLPEASACEIEIRPISVPAPSSAQTSAATPPPAGAAPAPAAAAAISAG